MEYFQSVLPPSFQSSLPAKDWVSDVSITSQGILSASYDGTATLWSTSGQQLAQVSHDLPVLSACIAGDRLISGGMDRRIQVHTLPSEGQEAAQTQYSFEHHRAPVASLRASPHASTHPRFLSSSWDGGLALWSVDPALETRETSSSSSGSKKRRKVQHATAHLKGLRPLQVLAQPDASTSASVNRALFDKTTDSRAWSAGADHALRSWDLELAAVTQSRVRRDPLPCPATERHLFAHERPFSELYRRATK